MRLAAALAAAGMVGAGYSMRIGGEEISLVDEREPSRRRMTDEPITSNRNSADLEALRAAQLRRERKVARQAKGFR